EVAQGSRTFPGHASRRAFHGPCELYPVGLGWKPHPHRSTRTTPRSRPTIENRSTIRRGSWARKYAFISRYRRIGLKDPAPPAHGSMIPRRAARVAAAIGSLGTLPQG